MDEDKIESILKKIENDENLKSYFWNKISSINNPSQYLKYLYKKKMFCPTSYPIHNFIEEGVGPFWEPSNYLIRVSELNNDNENKEITEILIKIINYYINFNFGIKRNHRMDYLFLKIIFLLPTGNFKKEYIKFIRKSLDFDKSLLIQVVLTDNLFKTPENYKVEDFLELLDLIFEFEFDEPMLTSKFFDEKNFQILLEHSKKYAIENCPIESIKIALNKITEILKKDGHMFNPYLVPSIENHLQNEFSIGNYDIQIVYFIKEIFDNLSLKNTIALKNCVKLLLSNDYAIFKRFALFLIKNNYEVFKDFFWNIDYNPMDVYGLRHEICVLFEKNCLKFNKNEIKRIITWINTSKYIMELKKENNDEKVICYQKLRWLQSLENSSNPQIKQEIANCRKFHNKKIKDPYFGISIRPVQQISSKYERTLCKKNVEDIIKCLSTENFHEKSQSPFFKDELESSFVACIKNNPYKFLNNLNYFKNVSIDIQYNLFKGFFEIINSDNLNQETLFIKPKNKAQDFDLTPILEFILEIFENINKNNYNKYLSLLNIISLFVNRCIQNDKIFNNSIEKFEKIILFLLNFIDSKIIDIYKEISDDNIIINVINSTAGRVYDCMFEYLIKYYETNEKVFNKKIKSKLEYQLKNQNDSPIFLVSIGQFFPFLYIMVKEFVKNNLINIFPEEDDLWKFSFSGYLSHVINVYIEIYELLNEKNYYSRAIKSNFKDSDVNYNLVRHIVIMYFENLDDIYDENSLINILIKNKNPKHISDLVRFVSKKSDVNEKIIVNLWNQIRESDEQGDIVSYTLKWIDFINIFDDKITEVICYTLQYTNRYNNRVLETLLKYTEENGKKYKENICKIINEVLTNSDYVKEEDLIKTLKYLHSTNCYYYEKICEKYSKENNEDYKRLVEG